MHSFKIAVQSAFFLSLLPSHSSSFLFLFCSVCVRSGLSAPPPAAAAAAATAATAATAEPEEVHAERAAAG